MTDRDGVVHIAGSWLRVGNQLRQRCAWCGALILNVDLERAATPKLPGAAGFEDGHPTWAPGALVCIDGNRQYLVATEAEAPLPDNACGQLDHEVTA